MEKIIDAHLHVHPFPTNMLERDVKAQSAVVGNLLTFLDEHVIEKAHVNLLYERNFLLPLPSSPKLRFSCLIDFRREDAEDTVERARSLGYVGIKFLTYEQKITKADFSRVMEVARFAERFGMVVTICATFGGLHLYEFDGLHLASFLLSNNIKSPVVLAHAGGARVREAMLLMDAAPRVYLDTSFTTTFWKNSAVIQELRYVIERYQDRVMFGSDHPSVDFTSALRDARRMLKGLSNDAKNAYLYKNADMLWFR
jgi:predicted TIM-barrel fold metal-dependent hydrolase